MSAGDFEPGAEPDPPPSDPREKLEEAFAAMGSALDPAVLARMANEFFQEWQESLEVDPAPGPQRAHVEEILPRGIEEGREEWRARPDDPDAEGPSDARRGAPDRPGFYFLDETPRAGTGASPEAPFSLSLFEPEVVPRLDLPPEAFDARALRRDFPILQERIDGRPLIWLDNAATTQKPRCVLERMTRFYEHEYSNVHRAAHTLAARATDAYETARQRVQAFLNAPSPNQIVFVRGTTEAINLVAQSWGRSHLAAGDEIVITWIEHHSNIVPWQLLAAEKGARLRVAPVDDDGQVLLEEYAKLCNPRTRIVALSHVSNALGTILPVREMIEVAHRHGARVLVDGAQAVSHLPVDVRELDADFYVFSGHKIYGPTGIGVLYGKGDLLDRMPPWHGGGNMISDVTFEKTTYQSAPVRFEAGTASVADAVGLGAALKYVSRIGRESIARHEGELLAHATEALRTVPGLRLIGTAREKAAVVAFVLDGHRSEDVGAALDREGIAVRAGHHCALPAMRRFGVESTVRPSLALYNTRDEIDVLAAALRRIRSEGGLAPG